MMTVAKALPKQLIDSLLADYKKPEDLIGEHGLLKQITKALVERALQAEMTEHLGHGKNEAVDNAAGNTRNGTSPKTLQGEFGKLPIRATDTATSNRSSSRSTRRAGQDSTTRYCRSTHAA